MAKKTRTHATVYSVNSLGWIRYRILFGVSECVWVWVCVKMKDQSDQYSFFSLWIVYIGRRRSLQCSMNRVNWSQAWYINVVNVVIRTWIIARSHFIVAVFNSGGFTAIAALWYGVSASVWSVCVCARMKHR